MTNPRPVPRSPLAWLRALRSLAWTGVLASGAVAQQVWPPQYANAPGNAVLNTPFTSPPGHPTAMTRTMVVIDPASLPFGPNTVISRLSLRRDTRYPNQGYGSCSGTLVVNLGRGVARPGDVHDVRFPRLWDGAWTTVYQSNQPFVVPAAGAPGASVPPFNVVVNFTRNFVYTGGPLVVEFQFTPTSGSTAWRVDGFAVPRPANGSFRSVGLGCQGSNGRKPFHYVLPETALPGAVLTTQVEELHGAQPLALHMLGFQAQPQPIDLGALGVGPAGCMLRIDPVLQFPCAASLASPGFRRATSQVQLPAQPAAVGALLYSQWLGFDAGVQSALPIVLSDAHEITLGQVWSAPTMPSARTIWKYGALSYGNVSGKMVLDDYAPILRFN
jgi:hypothetical protein